MSTNKSALGICKGNLLACHSLPPATFSRSTRVDNQMRRLIPRRYSPVFSDDLSRISRLVLAAFESVRDGSEDYACARSACAGSVCWKSFALLEPGESV